MMTNPDSLAMAAAWLRDAQHIVVFTGAGASAESGIPTFRDDDGFWREFPVDGFATWSGIVRTALRQPRRVADFLYAVLHPIASARPNAGHVAVADLERHVCVTVVTQNVDGLHREAGNTIVYEVHGSLFEVVSLKGRFRELLSRRELLRISESLDRARRGCCVLPRTLLAIRRWVGVGLRGIRRPNLVLFGDGMAEPAWSRSLTAVRECDCLIQVGCSGAVWPAAQIPDEARRGGARVISIDPQPSAGLWLAGTAAEVLPALVQSAFGDSTDANAS